MILPIFLYHVPLTFWLWPYVMTWPPVTRICVTTLFAIIGTVGAVLILQGIIPNRWRRWILGA